MTTLTKRPPLADADPRTIWQEALARGVEDPGIIIATADYLVDAGRFDHALLFERDLRQRSVVEGSKPLAQEHGDEVKVDLVKQPAAR